MVEKDKNNSVTYTRFHLLKKNTMSVRMK